MSPGRVLRRLIKRAKRNAKRAPRRPEFFGYRDSEGNAWYVAEDWPGPDALRR